MSTNKSQSLLNFDPFKDWTVGLDRYMESFDNYYHNFQKVAKNYPPCNIRKEGDKKYVIEMAVAGFAENELSVVVDGDKLVITGKAEQKASDEKDYIFHGLAQRQFQRVFALTDRIEVNNAKYVNGLLTIWLDYLAKTNESRSIPINKNDSQLLNENTK